MKSITEYRPVIIGIDHGYGNIKTAHEVLRCGVERISGEAIASENVLVYRGISYVIGENHLTYRVEKTNDDNFYLLTLAAIAEELKHKGGFTEAKVILAAGLPLARVASQKDEFRKYMLQAEEPEFDYKGKHYHLHIDQVLIFPQGFAETVIIGKLPGDNMILDIGNGTMNVAKVVNGKPIEKSLVTLDYGVSFCVRDIQSELSRRLGRVVEERKIEERLINGCNDRSDEISLVTAEMAEKYAEEIINQIHVYGYDEIDTRLHVFGGGGKLLKNHSGLSEKSSVTFYDDICANAKGYEKFAELKLGMGGNEA